MLLLSLVYKSAEKSVDTLRDQKLADMSCVGVALLMGRASGDNNFYKLINCYKCPQAGICPK